MSGFIQPVFLSNATRDQVNFSTGIQPISITNLNAQTNSVLYTTDGINIKGDNALTFDENLQKLNVGSTFSYISSYPIGVGAGRDEATFHTGFFSQNKNANDGASTHILVTNDLGTDFSFYGGLDMASSNAVVQYNQFGTMKNALGISSQSSSIVLTPNAGYSENINENSNIIFTYQGGTKAIIINDNGSLIVGANNPTYSGSSYGGDDGGTNKVLTSDGVNGLKWTPIGGLNSFYNVFYENKQQTVKSGGTITLFSKVNQLNIIPDLRCLVQCAFNFSLSNNNDVLTFSIIDDDTSTILKTLTQSITSNGHQNMAISFDFTMPSVYSLSYSITVKSNHTISTDANDFYSICFNEIQAS